MFTNETDSLRGITTTTVSAEEPVQLITQDPIFGTGCQACCSGNVDPSTSGTLYNVSNVSL